MGMTLTGTARASDLFYAKKKAIEDAEEEAKQADAKRRKELFELEK